MPRNDGRIEPGQKLAGAISARAWNRAQDAADRVLGVATGFSAVPGAGDDFGIVYANTKSLFGEPGYLGGYSTGLTAPPYVRSGSMFDGAATPFSVGQPSAADLQIIAMNPRAVGGGPTLAVCLDNFTGNPRTTPTVAQRWRVRGPAIVRVISYTNTINLSGNLFGTVVALQPTGGTAGTARNMFIRVEPAGTIPVSVITSLTATGAGNAPATGWGIVNL